MAQCFAGNYNSWFMRHFADCTCHFRHVVGFNVATGIAADCIYIVGLIFLLYMAWLLWREKPDKLQNFEPMSARKQVGFALSVSLLNPHAIIDTIGVIGTSASVYNGLDKVLFTIATVSVSWLWFIFLAVAGRILGSVDKTGRYIVILNKVSSVIILIVSFVIVKHIIQLL